jgi:hypothetical protein
MKPRKTVPHFESAADEAKWWDDHQGMVERNLLEGIAKGTASQGVAERLSRQLGVSKNITMRIAVEDIERARRLAEVKGIGYQTLMKMLLHEALARGRSDCGAASETRALRERAGREGWWRRREWERPAIDP